MFANRCFRIRILEVGDFRNYLSQFSLLYPFKSLVTEAQENVS